MSKEKKETLDREQPWIVDCKECKGSGRIAGLVPCTTCKGLGYINNRKKK